AFAAVTAGPVDEDELALPEVSRRSPLASWKMLVRAIASYYRREDEACLKYLDAIQADSAPARLVPAMRAMLEGKTSAPLNAASTALLARTTDNTTALRHALETLDLSFASKEHGRILNGIRAAVHECQRSAPGVLERLKQHIAVRAAMTSLDQNRVNAAAGGLFRKDAYYFRLLARGMEETRDIECMAAACPVWNDFRVQASREGWFKANGAEAAAIYLHLAELVRKIPA